MSSDLSIFDNSFFPNPFISPPHLYEPLREIQDDPIQETNNPIDKTGSFNQPAYAFLPSSPPRAELENLSVSQLDKTEYSVKTEECQLTQLNIEGFGNCFSPHSFDVKFMQRSYSSTCFENNQKFMFQPLFDSVFESHGLQNRIMSSPESGFSAAAQIRRVCSTGDLQHVEATFKARRYNAEERKERIDRYRAKRTQRNFNKTVKYACRKALADNRPRVRGRFVRNDEAGEIPKASMFQRYEDDLWIDGFHEEVVDGVGQHGTFFDIFGYQNYSY